MQIRTQPDRWCLGILVLLVLVLFMPFWTGGKLLAGGDLVNQYIPYKFWWAKVLGQGYLPLWNGEYFCGRPFSADVQIGTFYPFNWLFVLCPPELGFTLLTLFHFLLLSVSSFFLLRRFFPCGIALWGAVVFCLGGFFVSRLLDGIALFIFAGSWLPLIFYFAIDVVEGKNRSWLWVGIVLALQFLSGAAQLFLYSLYLLLSLFLFNLLWERDRKALNSVLHLCLSLLLCVVLIGAQLLPSVEFMYHSFERAGKTPWDYITKDSLQWRYVLTWLMPRIFAPPEKPELYWGGTSGFWEINSYGGALTIWLFMLVPWVWLRMRDSSQRKWLLYFVVVAVGAFWLGFGQSSWLFGAFYQLLPGFNKFRVPARAIFLWSFSMSFVGCFVLHALIRWRARGLPLILGIFSVLVLGLLLVAVMAPLTVLQALGFYHSFPQDFVLREPEIYRELVSYSLGAVVRFSLLSLGGFAVLALIHWRGMHRGAPESTNGSAETRGKANLLLMLLVGLTVVDLLGFGRGLVTFYPAAHFRRAFYMRSPLVESLAGSPHTRYWSMLNVFDWLHDQNQLEIYPNRPLMHELHWAGGYDPVYLRSFGEYYNMLNGEPLDRSPGGLLFIKNLKRPELLNFINVGLVLSYLKLPGPQFTLVREFPFGLKLYGNKQVLGEAYVGKYVGKYVGGELPEEEGLWLRAETENAATVQLRARAPQRVEWWVQAEPGELLVWTQNFYPGWRAHVNGKVVRPQKVQGTLMGVRLPAKDTLVSFHFAPFSLALGLFLSLLGVSLVILLITLRIPNRKRLSPTRLPEGGV